jgi:glycine betaine/proline transport system substrate-binding protein
MKVRTRFTGLLLILCCSASAYAQDPAECRPVHFADIGWTDIAATTALASTVFTGLGYQPTKTIASVPIALTGVKSKQIDVFLGDWRPAMDGVAEPFIKSGSIKVLTEPNLIGAKYTLAVPSYVYDAGLKSFADIAKFGDKLDHRIYGLGSGGAGNVLVQKMIDSNQFGLKDFKLVESSEAGMLVEVNRAVRSKKWVVFLGWDPHPMNIELKMNYLSGGDAVFGPNYGEAKVYTMVPPDYLTRCPNAGRFVTNLKFTPSLESEVMQSITTDKKEPNVAAREWLKRNPGVLTEWLTGVKTFDGKDALPAMNAYLAGQ